MEMNPLGLALGFSYFLAENKDHPAAPVQRIALGSLHRVCYLPFPITPLLWQLLAGPRGTQQM